MFFEYETENNSANTLSRGTPGTRAPERKGRNRSERGRDGGRTRKGNYVWRLPWGANRGVHG